ncbi:MAG: DUF1850 domain-containing protein [Syntrophales bacterium]|jgi:hypothetical protein|nr:DUF1850 domain-containing protein [Syntrophales bacterium]
MPLPSCLAESADGLQLQILSHPEGGLLWHAPVAPGDLFLLEYTHSSDGTPVRGIFRVAEEGRFVMLEEQYVWYGAGLESHPRATISYDGGWTRVFVNRPFRELLIRVGWVSRQVISSGDSRVALNDLAPGGSLLQLRIAKR